MFRTPYLSVFSPNTGKHGPEKASYLGTFHAVQMTVNMIMRISTIAADFLFYLSHPAKGIHSKSQKVYFIFIMDGWHLFFLRFCFVWVGITRAQYIAVLWYIFNINFRENRWGEYSFWKDIFWCITHFKNNITTDVNPFKAPLTTTASFDLFNYLFGLTDLFKKRTRNVGSEQMKRNKGNSPVMVFYFNTVNLLIPSVHWKVIKYVWPFIGNEVLKETTLQW